MVRAVLVVVALTAVPSPAQTIYTWTDSRGTVHYTDDPSIIPSNVKAKTTEGAEISNTGPAPKIEAAPERARALDTPSAAPGLDEEYWRREFRAARDRIRELEDELGVDLRKFQDPSVMPMGNSYYCAPGFYSPGFISPGFVAPGAVRPGFPPGGVPFGAGSRGFSSSSVGFGGSLNVPLGGAGSLNVNANTVQSVSRGTSTVAPFVGVGGHFGFGYGGPCWYQMTGEYAYTRDRIEKTRAALARAREDLSDLERRAANAAVPLEWRR